MRADYHYQAGNYKMKRQPDNILHPDIESVSENQSEITEGLYPFYSSSEN